MVIPVRSDASIEIMSSKYCSWKALLTSVLWSLWVRALFSDSEELADDAEAGKWWFFKKTWRKSVDFGDI